MSLWVLMIHDVCFSTPQKEGRFLASKWMYVRMLLMPEELKALLDSFPSLYLFDIAKVTSLDRLYLDKETFLKAYEQSIQKLSYGSEKGSDRYALALSDSLESFYFIRVGEDRALTRIKTPVVEMRPFYFTFSKELSEFFVKTFSVDEVFWGIEFALPQFYQDPKTMQPIKNFHNKELFSTQLFKGIQSFAREKTEPATFLVNDKKIIAPFKLGKQAFEFAKAYSHLKEKGLQIIVGP